LIKELLEFYNGCSNSNKKGVDELVAHQTQDKVDFNEYYKQVT
jgi:hypothetical protein